MSEIGPDLFLMVIKNNAAKREVSEDVEFDHYLRMNIYCTN